MGKHGLLSILEELWEAVHHEGQPLFVALQSGAQVYSQKNLEEGPDTSW